MHPQTHLYSRNMHDVEQKVAPSPGSFAILQSNACNIDVKVTHL